MGRHWTWCDRSVSLFADRLYAFIDAYSFIIVFFSLPVASAGANEAIRNGDPPSQTLVAIAKAVEAINKRGDGDEASSLEPPKSLCGRVTNVAIWEEKYWILVMETLKVGTFVRLRNVHEGSVANGLGCK